MPVGALIGGGLSLVGSVIGGNSQSKAANKAADTSLAVAQQNNALARDIYGQNKAVLDPYVQRGNAAGAAMNALLGLGGSPSTGTNALAQYQGVNPDTSGNRMMAANDRAVSPRQSTGWNALDQALEAQGYFDQMPGPVSGYGGGTWNVDGTQATPVNQGQTAQEAANDAFGIFRNSTGYQFRLGEGLDAVNSNAFGAGVGQSGAALKALQEYGQNFASNEFGNYMGYLGNQQGVGLGAGSALAGVGQNYVNNISANNNSAGTAAANAALAGANNPFANALGQIGGTILGGVKW